MQTSNYTAANGFPQPQYTGSASNNKRNLLLVGLVVALVVLVVVIVVLLSKSSSNTPNNNNPDTVLDPTTDKCAENPCANGGTCNKDTGACKCIAGYSGDTCETSVCLPNPCKNKGVCSVSAGAAKCACVGGYTGSKCSVAPVVEASTGSTPPVDLCARVSCKNEGTCDSDTGKCVCVGGFTGATCNVAPPADACANVTCANGGTCVKSTGRCNCAPGFSGITCDTAVPADPCASVTCKNSGSCSKTTGKCVCTGGFSGASCETAPVAASTGTGPVTPNGTCVKGQTKGENVLFIGESFIQLSTIPDQVAKNAVAAGSLKQGEKYLNYAVSGKTMAGSDADAIPNQYNKAVNAHPGVIKYVMMDGGGNDCLINNNADAVAAPAKALFQKMATNKVEKILYFFYPDPFGTGMPNLKTCLDKLRPQMQAICANLTAPTCTWLDLRPTWNGHTEYATSDGIHPSAAGSAATGDIIWKTAVSACIAQ